MPHPHTPWQDRIYARLQGQPYPLWIDDEGVLPAASLWYVMREKLESMRSQGICTGNRVLIALPPNRSFVAWLLASLWQGCTVALAPHHLSSAEIKDLCAFLDVSLCITEENIEQRQHIIHAPTPDISFLLASSGTTASQPRRIALSAENVLSVIDSHLPKVHLYDRKASVYAAARVLSVLPLHHAFGLVIDFFTAFFAGAEIVRDSAGGRNTAQMLALAKEYDITHCSMVPLLVKRLAESEEGRSFLCGLQGGVIGGAPVDGALATFLRTTRLRVGYGQTEAAPGITLGESGVWSANYIGKALGCEARINTEGVLEFRGNNAFLGYWTEQGLVRSEAEWVNTGDYVTTVQTNAPISENAAEYVFIGRADDTFKLDNGRFIPAPHWEALLKSRIESCLEAMITSLDGKTCSIALLLDSLPQSPTSRIISTFPEIPPDIISFVHTFLPDEWRYTPKGSIDRRLMQELLGAIHNKKGSEEYSEPRQS